MAGRKQFPDEFYWGASTAAHQVEGGTENDWSRWEQENAVELAKTARKRLKKRERYFAALPDWEQIKEQARTPENYISGEACDHYNRFRKDFDRAADLNHNAHRFSIEWSRIQPEKGVINEDALDHYREVINALHDREIEPFITLWHFTSPQWFADEGGWTNPEAIDYFDQYVETVVNEFADEVQHWITINEPQVHTANTYLGERPAAAQRGVRSYLRSLKHLVKAHNQAYGTIKAIDSTARVGLSTNIGHHVPYKNKLLNRATARIADWWWNDRVLNKTHEQLDFIGLNHYNRNVIHHGRNVGDPEHTSDMGWGLYPDSIYSVLTDLQKYETPIIITENGLADSEDAYRKEHLEKTLCNVHQAIEDGVDVEGYLHWSLIDNFEWDQGFWPRFGLIEVDYDTQERTVRDSAQRYAEIIDNNAVGTDTQ